MPISCLICDNRIKKASIVSPVIHFLSLCFSNGTCLAAGIGVEIIEPLGIIDDTVKLCVNLFQIGLGVIIWRTHKLRLPSSYIRAFGTKAEIAC